MYISEKIENLLSVLELKGLVMTGIPTYQLWDFLGNIIVATGKYYFFDLLS